MQKIFVGIPVLNRFDLLEKAIESLDYEPMELFVVDNNTVCDKNKEEFKRLKDKFKFDSFSPRYNLGVAASWNRIITTAWSRGYDFVYIGSNDTTLGPGTLKALVEMDKPEPECVWMVNQFNFWCLRLSAVPKIGLVDENFMPAYFEDNDYQRRIKLAGLECVCMGSSSFEKNGRMVPAVSSNHLGSQTIRSDQEYAIHNSNTFNNGNRNHYIMKWGGPLGAEKFSVPYNEPANPINWWPDPASTIALRDWDNNKRKKNMLKTLSPIDRKFEEAKNSPSDINQHLDALKNYASECSHITEMGVRWVISTWAFLSARPKKLISYDISDCKISEVFDIAKDNGIEFVFKKADVLKVDIEFTDLLFIDTFPAYCQLKKELQLHAPKAKKYIIMHDTETFKNKNQALGKYKSCCTDEDFEKQGLELAIQYFLSTEEGKNWRVRDVYTHNNGLTVLERRNKIE